MKKNGYRTGMFGKNHLFTYDKLAEVWDEFNEICLGNYDDHEDYQRAYSSFKLEESHPYNITSNLTGETIEFIKRSEGPFFAWVNYQDPHPAFTCPSPYKELFDPKDISLPQSYYEYDAAKQPIRNEIWRKHSDMDSCSEQDLKKAIATYMGQVRYIDDSVGRFMDFLEQSGLRQNTVVLLFSDHGELLGDYKMTHKNPTFYDCLTKIPVLISHPDGRWSGYKAEGLTEEIDLAPTLLETLGIEIPPTMVGQSYKSNLDAASLHGKESILCEAGGAGPTQKTPIEGLLLKAPSIPTNLGPGSMIRKGPWKLSIYHDDECELYNIEEDPHEIRNLYDSEEHKEVQAELTLLLMKRTLGVKVRDVGLDWPSERYPFDLRFESLHKFHSDSGAITGIEKNTATPTRENESLPI